MKRPIFITALWLILTLSWGQTIAQQPIRVACIGNSVTYGAGISDREKYSYPSQLQLLLGETYEVRNFGHSGATLLHQGHKPYHLTEQFAEALAFVPDIAVIHLGLNDTDPRNWPDYRMEFKKDYSWLIDTLRKTNPKIEIHVAVLTPIFSGHPRFKSGMRDWHRQIRTQIQEVAQANGVHIMDFYQAFKSRPDLFPDNIHPNQDGARKMAGLVHVYLKKDFGGLSMPSVFGNGMVLQRGDSIPVFGQGNPGKPVRVSLSAQSKDVMVNPHGKWIAYLDEVPTGGPYELKVHHNGQQLTFSEVMVGDVWLCMGQSNMAFPLKASLSWEEENLKEDKGELGLFQFKPLSETDNKPWDSLTLQRINELSYFGGNWKADKSGFSAVAYHFGQALQKEVDVPIGLVQLTLGGAPIEAFIDRETLEQDELLVDMLDDWESSDFVMPWVRERAAVNLSNKQDRQQRHPYQPAYIHEAGIEQLLPFGLKGILWYQGESNTHNAALYARLFQTMVEDYREKWGDSLLPVYFVQLPGMSRPSWPYFRNMQRDLSKKIPNTGMAVALDLGDSLDVHPRAKKEVGRRLALQALSKTYGKIVLADGTSLIHVEKWEGKLVLGFENGAGLSIVNGEKVQGFELLGNKGERISVSGQIEGERVVLPVPEGVSISKILYGFEPFSPANLVNKAGLPMGTTEWSMKTLH
ncbi:GDSL-type esterase/lipase family protein [Echinicola sediminis]